MLFFLLVLVFWVILFVVIHNTKLLLSSQPGAWQWKLWVQRRSLQHPCPGSCSPSYWSSSLAHTNSIFSPTLRGRCDICSVKHTLTAAAPMTQCMLNNSSKTQVKIHFNFAVFIYYINFTCYIFTVGQVLFIFKKTKIKL